MRLKICLPLYLVLACLLTGCQSTVKQEYTNLSAEQIYARAQAHMAKNNYQAAVKDYEAIEARFPYSRTAESAQLGLGYAFYRKGDVPAALAANDRFIRMHPNHERVDYAYYMKGLINFDQNFSMMYRYLPVDRSYREPTQAQESFEDFKLLLQRFPASQYAPEARQRMIALRNQMADYEFHVAQYYMKRQAYLSAANRLNYILTHFDRSPVVIQSLHLLREAYVLLGMPALVQKTDAALQQALKNS